MHSTSDLTGEATRWARWTQAEVEARTATLRHVSSLPAASTNELVVEGAEADVESAALEWEQRMSVHDLPSAYPNLALVYDVFARTAVPPSSFWARGDDAVRNSIDGLAPELAHFFGNLAQVVFSHLGLDPTQHEVECWSNRAYRVGPRVELHVDNDETARASTGVVTTPQHGAIYYVGGAEGVGGTWFRPPLTEVDQDPDLFQRPEFARVIERDGVAVSFVPGRLIVFDGRMPHCPMPFAPVGRPRVALLCNIWPRGRRFPVDLDDSAG